MLCSRLSAARLMLLVAVMLAVALAGPGYAQDDADDLPVLAVFPLGPVEGSPDLRALLDARDDLAEEVAIQPALAGRFRVLPPSASRERFGDGRSLDRVADQAAVARDLGADAALGGTLRRLGDDLYTLRLVLIDTDGFVVGGVSTRVNSLDALYAAVPLLVDELTDGDAPDPDTGETIAPAFREAWKATRLSDYARGDCLVQSIRSRVYSLSPMMASSAYATRVLNWVLEPLAARDPDTLEYTGVIARSWEMKVEERRIAVRADGEERLLAPDEPIERGWDERTREVPVVTFELRDDVCFSDGMPLTAADVAFTYRLIMNPRINCGRIRAYLSRIGDVTADGDSRVTFTYLRPYFDALGLAAGLEVLPEHIYGAAMDDPDRLNHSTGWLVGSGPYCLPGGEAGDWTPDQPIELVRNGRYWGDVQPAFDRLRWRVIESDAAVSLAFRNEETDIYNAGPSAYEAMCKDPAIRRIANPHAYMSPTAGYLYVAWNQRNDDGSPSRFADKRVRQAMTFLTDRQRIADEIFLGYAVPANGPFHPASRQCDPDVQTRSHDIDRARMLLAEAGFRDRDGDGVIEDADGEPFRFELIYPSGSENFEMVVFLLKDLYAAAGINLRPRPTDFSQMLMRIDRRDYEAMSLGWTSGLEIDIHQMFHSSQRDNGGDNYTGYTSDALDAALDAARTEMDGDRRMELWQLCHRILWEDQPYTFLFRRQTLLFVQNRIRNVRLTGIGLNTGGSGLACPWYVPADEQRHGD